MAQTYSCYVDDVTCEKCVARVETALQGITGVTDVTVTRQPNDIAEVSWSAEQPIAPAEVEERVAAASQGTEHHYHVRWPQ
jgi:copper chaperone CopZ